MMGLRAFVGCCIVLIWCEGDGRDGNGGESTGGDMLEIKMKENICTLLYSECKKKTLTSP